VTRLLVFIAGLTLAAHAPAHADIYPMPGPENPRIQSASWEANQNYVLTALPETALTVMLEPGEIIQRVTVNDDRSWNVSVSAEFDSFQITPSKFARQAELSVQSNKRSYSFTLQSDLSLTAAYLVRFSYGEDFPPPILVDPMLDAADEKWNYRLRGDRSVRPQRIEDDGRQTFITYGEEQALPAVFAVGPTGEEEVVDGYMRDGRFVIDRVHEKLVFRIDKDKATAKRNDEAEAAQ